MERLVSHSLLPGLFALALSLRVWGIAFGLPYPYHPDEPAHVLQALAIARGLPKGLTFANPPLYKYLLLAEYVATYAVGRVAGVYASPKDFVTQFRADPTLLYLIGRITSALLGAVTVFAAYALTAALHRRRAALLAAWFTAVSYLLVRESHFAVNDALVTLLTTLALWASVRIVQTGERRDYLLGGAAVGLAFAAKYQGAVALLPLVLAHVLRPGRRLMDLLFGLGVAATAVLVGFPSLALETARVVHDIYIHLYRKGQIGYSGMDPAGGYVYYLKVLLWGLGWPILTLAGAGMLLAVVRRDRGLLVVATLPLALYIFMGSERMYFARYILPALPPLVVLAAVAIDSIVDNIRFSFHPLPAVLGDQRLSVSGRYLRNGLPFASGARTAIYLASAVLLGAPLLQASVRFGTILTREDTRTEARAWIESHIPAGTRIAVDWFPFGPPLDSDRYDLLVANGWALFDLVLDDYRQRDVEYLVTSSYISDQWVLDPARDAQRRAFQASLAGEAKLIVKFQPHVGASQPAFVYDQIYAPFDHLERLERPGPTVKIYALPSREAIR